MSQVKSYEVDKPEKKSLSGKLVKTEDVQDKPLSEKYTHAFTTDKVFASQDKVLEWTRNLGKQHVLVIVITKSDNGGLKRKTFMILGFERGSKYIPYKEVYVV
ncbi:uncharacterized protein LOC130735438 [Lotus japonicus]|uniref:uncharacterized protein LOC130735438 n=1 Tax=Lotus japonicus TaxID=34305 RepID=UPI00258649A7|nr:uncharacterized protein LOC130735438 [Lotus japonicus]